MGDFIQSGPVTTIHRLPGSDLAGIVENLESACRKRPAVLLVPALASEMEGKAFHTILEKVAGATYLSELILVLGRAEEADFDWARTQLSKLPIKTSVVWPESPSLTDLMHHAGPAVDPGGPGKGRDVWLALGYILAKGAYYAMGLHDADILTYSLEIPTRLLLPVTDPRLSFAFCKGYYPRVSDRLNGRVTRLMVAPLVRILNRDNPSEFLDVLESLRYPLAGEFAMTMELAGKIPIPRNWGLEIGLLSSVFNQAGSAGMCQAALCENYRHKHQDLSPADGASGLHRMAIEVIETLLREISYRESGRGSLAQDLYREAVSMLPSYRADALANGLVYSEEDEKEALGTFSKAVNTALGKLKGSSGKKPLPPWNEMESLAPGFRKSVADAVDKDNL